MYNLRFLVLYPILIGFFLINYNASSEGGFSGTVPCTDSYFSDAWEKQELQFLKIVIDGCECWYAIEYYSRITDPTAPGRTEIQITEILGLKVLNDECCATAVTTEELWSKAHLQILLINDMEFNFDPVNTNYQYVIKEYPCIHPIFIEVPYEEITLDPSNITNFPTVLPSNFPPLNPDNTITFLIRSKFLQCVGTVCCKQVYKLLFNSSEEVVGMEWDRDASVQQNDECEFPCVAHCGDLQFDAYDESLQKQRILSHNENLKIQILPNPNSGEFQLLVESTDNFEAVVYMTDLLGNKLFEMTTIINIGENNININEILNSGVYFLNIRENNTILKTKKIIIE